MFRALAIAISLSLATFCYAQQPGSEYRAVMVNVLDQRGNPLRDLTNKEFRLRVGGKPVDIRSAKYNIVPHRILILLDISGSMAEEQYGPKWRLTREALQDFLAQTPPDVPVAMVTFSAHVQDAIDFPHGRTAVLNWVQRNSAEPPRLKYRTTALMDATLEALKLLQPFQPGDSIYAITDAGDNSSFISARHVRDVLIASGVRLFAFLFDETALTEQEASQDAFLEMMTDSGGFAFGFRGQRGIIGPSWRLQYDYDQKSRNTVEGYTRVLNAAASGYWTLEFKAPVLNKRGKVKVEVLDQAGKARKDIMLAYQRFLMPN